MRTLPLLAIALMACEKSGTLVVPTDDDTGSPTTDDTGGGGGDDSQVTDDSSEPLPDPEPDTSIWNGSRLVAYDGCEETLYEEGYELLSDWEYYDWAAENCPDCTNFYYVEVSPDEVCGIPVTTEVYRGLVLNEPDAEVWTFSYRGAEILDSNASFDGMVVEYAYESNGIEIQGLIEFPELPQ